jgi:hypothetical protein
VEASLPSPLIQFKSHLPHPCQAGYYSFTGHGDQFLSSKTVDTGNLQVSGRSSDTGAQAATEFRALLLSAWEEGCLRR